MFESESGRVGRLNEMRSSSPDFQYIWFIWNGSTEVQVLGVELTQLGLVGTRE
jgi:hypothetical protein